MDVSTALPIAQRAHAFIDEVAVIVTDEPEFAAMKIAALFERDGEQLDADSKALLET